MAAMSPRRRRRPRCRGAPFSGCSPSTAFRRGRSSRRRSIPYHHRNGRGGGESAEFAAPLIVINFSKTTFRKRDVGVALWCVLCVALGCNGSGNGLFLNRFRFSDRPTRQGWSAVQYRSIDLSGATTVSQLAHGHPVFGRVAIVVKLFEFNYIR